MDGDDHAARVDHRRDVFHHPRQGACQAGPPASLRLEAYAEGLAVQILHVGPYSAEGPTIARMHREFLPANGFAANGHHHEIYLSDPRKTAPEKLRTVIRQPVRKVAP